jgi:hypothetical protein
MVLRDLTMRGGLPTISQLNLVGSAIVYPIGGDLHRFLADRYGAWRLNLMYETAWKYDSFDEALQAVYGSPVERMTEEWHYALRQRFFPTVAALRPLGLGARAIAAGALKAVPLNLRNRRPEVAFMSPRSGYTNIYRKPLDGVSNDEVMVAGERSPEFESLHPFSSRLDSRDGIVLFSTKHGDRDAVVLWDVDSNRVVGRYQFDSLVGIISPAWSPAGDRIAFSALTLGGISDLYLLELRTGELVRVTDDPYEDLDPAWLPDGASLVFSSDRGVGGDEGARNLYQVRLASGAIRPITSGRWLDEAPRWDSEAGRIIFSSDRAGTFDIYTVDTLGLGRRETRIEGGLFDPAPLPGDRRILASVFSDLSWSAFAVTPDSQARSETFVLHADTTLSGRWAWSELGDGRARTASSRRYRREYSLDVAAGGAGATPGWGATQGAQLVLSDLLGDDRVAMSVSMYG